MFDNIGIGPLVSIFEINPRVIEDLNEDLLQNNFFPISLITDKDHVVFKSFKKDKPVAVLITVYYLNNYE